MYVMDGCGTLSGRAATAGYVFVHLVGILKRFASSARVHTSNINHSFSTKRVVEGYLGANLLYLSPLEFWRVLEVTQNDLYLAGSRGF